MRRSRMLKWLARSLSLGSSGGTGWNTALVDGRVLTSRRRWQSLWHRKGQERPVTDETVQFFYRVVDSWAATVGSVTEVSARRIDLEGVRCAVTFDDRDPCTVTFLFGADAESLDCESYLVEALDGSLNSVDDDVEIWLSGLADQKQMENPQ